MTSASWLHPGHLLRASAFYPLTGFYLAAAGLLMLVTSGRTSLTVALALLLAAAVLALLVATLTELHTVHRLVDGQRSELLARIDQLAELLVGAGVTVPSTGAAEHEARAHTIRQEQP